MSDPIGPDKKSHDELEVREAIRRRQGRLLRDELPVRCPNPRSGWDRVAERPRRCGFIPPVQFFTIRCDEAQHRAWIHAVDEDRLKPPFYRLDSDGVSVGIVRDLLDPMK